tara:strand:+ start:57 stop:482 length:426 start_codon:yes stop_codon:yes gene_type:complete
MEIVFTAYWESAPGVPLIAPGVIPTIRVRRLDTNALVLTDVAMTEVGDGVFKRIYATPVEGVQFSARGDGDPTAVSQVPASVRYQAGSGDNFAAEVYQNEGLDPNEPKVITVNSAIDMDEDVDQIHKDSVTVGNVTTTTRS